ncbi:PREDICTED: collagen alpha-2(IV) chain-like isoform X1 [Trachymyrmex septentrionalis]|uniref:collagen alpha-2(IV) chain-like isoform X1 n=1 Tax=Trachymyrmex septentrionalis TaxID=34720 RepID=UPI00084F3608|nr:PREDICTED: collagen alpha-2(IV) chain-like isoform X1 [Trachymyrmex septentrionalis]
MWIRSLQCSLAVFFACAFFAGSDSVSAGAYAGAYAGAGASALSSTSVLEDTENIPGTHDRHKGIRSYDSTGFPHDNNANRGVKSYGTPSGHGVSYDHGIKGGGHGYNKNDDCSKCKWENDDYWERDEPEEEGDENDGDECDDGQYRPHKVHHGPDRGHKPGSHPLGVHKTGPTGVYVDGGGGSPGSLLGGSPGGPLGGSPGGPLGGSPGGLLGGSLGGPLGGSLGGPLGGSPGGPLSSSPGGPLGGINYPSTGYSRPMAEISGYESTPKPGSSWNTPSADASKPGYSSVTAGAFGTTPSSWPDWNRGTTPSSFGSSPKPVWDGGHDGRFPSSQRPGAPVLNFDVTTKPGQGWPTNQFPSSSSSAIPYAGSGISSPSYGNPQKSQNRPYGQSGTQSTYTGAYAGAMVTSGVGSPYGATSSFGRKDHPFDLHKPTNTQTSQRPYGGTDQASSSTDSNYYGLGGYNKPTPGSYSTPTTVINTIGTTKRPYEGIDSPKTVPEFQTDPFASRKSPGSPSGAYGHPGVTKPSYGSTTSWLGQTGSSPWHGTGTTPHTGFPTLNTGFETTKTPFSHVSTPSSMLSAPYDRTGPKQPNFNIASSSAIASAGASAFGISPSTYNTPSITGTTSLYGTTPAYRGSSSYTPGVKGSIGSTKPAYGIVPHGTYPNIESGTWPGGQPGSGTRPWSSGKPGDGSGITPGRYSPGILPTKQPQGSGTWPSGQPASGSGAWPGQVQSGPGSGPECGPGRNCGSATGLQGGSNCGGCCGNNCNSDCSGRDNVPAQGLCGGVIGSSGVNKTYYPAGTGDGNVPNIGAAYGPDSLHNIEAGTRPVYPGTQGTSITSESPVPWNSANPFLYGAGSSTPSSISDPWIENANNKPIGPGNPFLDSSWNRPKSGYSNSYNDRNVIPHKENTKPVDQRNLFLNNNNRRGDNSANPNEGVNPLEEKIPKGNNPFLIPLIVGNGGSDRSYGKYPDRSGTPGSFPGSGTPGNYPGSGTLGNYPGSGTSGNYPGSGTQGNYPGSEISGNYPGSGTPGNYLGSGTPGNYPGSGTPGSFPSSGTPGNYPGSRTPGNYPGSGTPGSYPGSRSNPQSPDPAQCKLGLFGCGAPGSGSYAGGKHPGGAFGGNVETDTGNPGSVGNVPGGNPGIGGFAAGADHPGSGGNNLASSVSGAQARAYAGSFSSAQASSSSFAGSFPGASESANNFGGNLSPNGAQNQGGRNSWASSGASAFASSSAGSWPGNHPIDVKG